MDTKDIFQADLRKLQRNYNMKQKLLQEKAVKDPEMFNLFHFAQALAFEEAVEMMKRVFEDDMEEGDWE